MSFQYLHLRFDSQAVRTLGTIIGMLGYVSKLLHFLQTIFPTQINLRLVQNESISKQTIQRDQNIVTYERIQMFRKEKKNILVSCVKSKALVFDTDRNLCQMNLEFSENLFCHMKNINPRS